MTDEHTMTPETEEAEALHVARDALSLAGRRKRKSPERKKPFVPKEETREEKLYRLANARVTSAIKRIFLVGNLAGYKPSADEAGKIVKALDDAVSMVEKRLTAHSSTRDREGFQL